MRKISLCYLTISMVISAIGIVTKDPMLTLRTVWALVGFALLILEVRHISHDIRSGRSLSLELAQSNPHPYREPAPNIEPTELDGASEEERKVEAVLYLITMDLGRPVDNRERIRPRTPDINAPAPKPISE